MTKRQRKIVTEHAQRCELCRTMILKGNTMFIIAKLGARDRKACGPCAWRRS